MATLPAPGLDSVMDRARVYSDLRKLALTCHAAETCLKNSFDMYHLAEEIQPKDELDFGYPVGDYEMSNEETWLRDQSGHQSDLRDKLLESAKTIHHAIDEYDDREGDIPWKAGQKPETYHNSFGWGSMHEIKQHSTVHLLDSDFLDPFTLRESVERFYLYSKFSVTHSALYALHEPDLWGFGWNVDSLVHHIELQVPKFYVRSRQRHVDWIPSLAERPKDYFKKKKTVGTLTICMDYVNHPYNQTLRGDTFPLIQAWAEICFESLDKIVSAGYKVVFQITPTRKFRIKSEELTVECWMKKF